MQDERARAEVLAALEAVDLVAIFEEDTPIDLIAQVRPSVLVKGGDYTREQVVGHEIVEADGGEVRAGRHSAGPQHDVAGRPRAGRQGVSAERYGSTDVAGAAVLARPARCGRRLRMFSPFWPRSRCRGRRRWSAIFVPCWLGAVACGDGLAGFRAIAEAADLLLAVCAVRSGAGRHALVGRAMGRAALRRQSRPSSCWCCPVLFYHFERSSRGMWVFIAFLVSCALLMVMSWIVVM